MRWLLHGNVTAAVAAALVKREDQAQSVADAGIDAGAPASEVLQAAHARQLDVMTADPGMVDAAFASPSPFGRSIVHLSVDSGEVEQDDAVERLFARYKRLTPGRLYVVTRSRVKVRQLPGAR